MVGFKPIDSEIDESIGELYIIMLNVSDMYEICFYSWIFYLIAYEFSWNVPNLVLSIIKWQFLKQDFPTINSTEISCSCLVKRVEEATDDSYI